MERVIVESSLTLGPIQITNSMGGVTRPTVRYFFFYGYCCVRKRVCQITSWIACIFHYNDIIMGAIASQITSITIVYSAVNSGANQRKHRSSASLAFVRGIHRWPVNSPHKWPVTRKMFPLDGVILWQVSPQRAARCERAIWQEKSVQFWNSEKRRKLRLF